MKTLEDEFYSHLPPTEEPYAFENNWPYIMQATRNGLSIYRDNDSIAYVTNRYPFDEASPAVIACAIGPQAHALIQSIAMKEHARGRRTILKNVSADEVSSWHARGWVVPDEDWSSYSRFDDNSYPECIIARKTIIEMGYKRDWRRRINAFYKHRLITTGLFDPANDAAAHELLQSFARYCEAKGTETASEVVRGHLFFFDDSITHKIRLQHMENGVLIGWSFLTPWRATCFYNALVCKNEPNLMKFLVHESSRNVAIYNPAVRFFTMQGSEKSGQYDMKFRQNPIKTLSKTHLIFNQAAQHRSMI